MADIGITRSEVMATFERELPPGTQLNDIDWDIYISQCLEVPFILKQISLGLYDVLTFREEFLSVARSFPVFNNVDVCSALIENHFKNVRSDLARAYVRQVALHERHHLVRMHGGSNIQTLAQNEFECWAWMEKHYPQIVKLSGIAEQESDTMRPVLERIARIQTLQQAQ